MVTRHGVYAIVSREASGDGWYVYWETASAYGSRGSGLTREAADDLAERIRRGETKP